MEPESRHGSYLVLLLLLMIFVLILSAPLIIFYVSVHSFISYLLTAIIALALGHFCAKFVERITHKEKKEVLAGTIIPLPAVIGLTIFVVLTNTLGQLSSLNALFASLTYFVCFNIPFLVYFYEHERHKHHIIGFFIGVMFVAFTYSLTFFAVSSLISPSPIAQEVLSSPPEYSAVTNFVDECIKVVAREKQSIGYSEEKDFSFFVDNNLGKCINNFDVFKSESFKIDVVDSAKSSVSLANSTIVVFVYYPLIISERNRIKEISKFEIILER